MIPLYVGSVTEYSGKHFVAVGVGLTLKDEGMKVGHFKPYGSNPAQRGKALVDRDAEFFCRSLGIKDRLEDVCPLVMTENAMSHILTKGAQDNSKMILDAFKKVARGKDVVIVGGVSCICCGPIVGITESQFIEVTSAKVILTSKLDETVHTLDRLLAAKHQLGDNFKGVIFNRIPESRLDYTEKLVKPFMESHGINVYGVIRNDPVLGAVPVGELVSELGGTVLTGEDRMDNLVERFMIGAMNVSSALKHFRKQRNKAVITGGDRSDIQLAALETSTKALILTGDMYPNAQIITRAEEVGIPIVVVHQDTAEAVERCEDLMGHLSLLSEKKVKRVKRVFSTCVDWDRLKADCEL
jgi:BioD-like phosphotransacetylase family protein